MWKAPTLLAVAICAGLPAVSRADGNAPKVTVETIAAGLDTPMAVAIWPVSGEVFVSESGAGRVVRVPPNKDAKPQPVVTGFAVGQSADLPELRVGPLGLAFTTSDNLVVGSGGEGPGKDAVRIFAATPPGKSLTLADAKKTMTIKPGDASKGGEGSFYGIAAVPYALFATSRGDAESGWVSRSWIRMASGNKSEITLELRPFIDTTRLVHTGAPTALAVSKRGELVVSQAGKFDKNRDSRLTFYDPSNAKLLLNLPIGLFDVMGLAYSPQTGLLYAVDLAWADGKEGGKEGGLYRLDASDTDGVLGIKPVKIAPLDRPTSLAFAANGTLYVTTLGPASSKPAPGSPAAAPAAEKLGRLLRITGNL